MTEPKPRARENVVAFIDELWNYEVEQRGETFVAVCVTKDRPFDEVKRKRVTRIDRQDASVPFATRAEAEAFITKRKGGGAQA